MTSSVLNAVVVPVIRMSQKTHALTAITLLAEHNISTFEITLTTPGAAELISELTHREGILVGAGTVLDRAQAAMCIDAGARFIVSPVTRTDIAAYCASVGIACFLGAATPTEILTAHEAGATAVKIFPAAQLGGPAFVKAVKSVFPHIDLMPTGGIGLGDVPAYLSAGARCVGMGGKLVDEQAIRDGRYDDIHHAARQISAQLAELRRAP